MACEICLKNRKTVYVRNYPTETGKLMCINCIVDKVEYALI